MYGFRTTPRVCPGYDVWGYWKECDGEGDLGMDVHEETSFTYGPGKDIDSSKPVDVTVEFLVDDSGDNLIGYTVILKQGEKSYEVTKEGDYVAGLSKYIKAGMVIQVR